MDPNSRGGRSAGGLARQDSNPYCRGQRQAQEVEATRSQPPTMALPKDPPPKRKVYGNLGAAMSAVTSRDSGLRTISSSSRSENDAPDPFRPGRLPKNIYPGSAEDTTSRPNTIRPTIARTNVSLPLGDFVDVDLNNPPRQQPDLEIQRSPNPREGGMLETLTNLVPKGLMVMLPRVQASIRPANEENSMYTTDYAQPSLSPPFSSGSDQERAYHVSRERAGTYDPESSSPAAMPQAQASVSTSKSQVEGSTMGGIYKQYGPAGSPHHNNQSFVVSRVDGMPDSQSAFYDESISRQDGDSSGLYQADAYLIPTVGLQQVSSDNAMSVAASTVPSLSQANYTHRYGNLLDGQIDTRHNDRFRQFSGSSQLPIAGQYDDRTDNEYVSNKPHAFEPTSHDDIWEDVPMDEKNPKLLERNVSKELRRVSGRFDGITTADAFAAFTRQPRADGSARVKFNDPPSVPARSPLRPPPAALGRGKGSAATATSWETVEDRRSFANWEHEVGDFVIPGAKRCGDSIADVSDYQSDMDITEFDSTDRITQHPAPLAGATQYRKKTLTDAQRPVLLPVHHDFKVNGYPSNSSRVPPGPRDLTPIMSRPSPLSSHHSNPFKSSPPEYLSPRGASLDNGQRGANGNFELKNFASRIKNVIYSPELENRPSGSRNAICSPKSEDFSKHNRTYVTTTEHQMNRPRHQRAHVNEYGSPRVMDEGNSSMAAWERRELYRRQHGFPDLNLSTGHASSSRANQGRMDGPSSRRGNVSSFSGTYRSKLCDSDGINSSARARRDLAYTMNNPVDARDMREPRPLIAGYRKPTAPPQFENSRVMYDQHTLRGIEHRHYHREQSSNMQIAELPVLENHNPRQTYYYTESKKSKINNFTLLISCLLFVPSAFYAWGLLDWSLRILTKEEMSEFPKKQKRLAAAWFFFVVVAVAVGAGVYAYFRAHR